MNPRTEKIAKLFHTYYELLAPECGYSTRKESAVKWEDVPSANKQLMRATVDAVLSHLDREANFVDGCKVELLLSISGGEGESPFAVVGERGKVRFVGHNATVVMDVGDRQWMSADPAEMALYFKTVA